MLSPSVKGSLLKGSVKRICAESEIDRQTETGGWTEGRMYRRTNK
jgi:hypothetical protein